MGWIDRRNEEMGEAQGKEKAASMHPFRLEPSYLENPRSHNPSLPILYVCRSCSSSMTSSKLLKAYNDGRGHHKRPGDVQLRWTEGGRSKRRGSREECRQ